MHPAREFGLTRIEVSTYFYSEKDFNDNFSSIDNYKSKVDQTLSALNKMKNDIQYKVSFNEMVNSYFSYCKK